MLKSKVLHKRYSYFLDGSQLFSQERLNSLDSATDENKLEAAVAYEC